MHVRWALYLQRFSFIIKHTSGAANRVADALSRRSKILATLKIVVTGFDNLKNFYVVNAFFAKIWNLCHSNILVSEYSLRDGFLFKQN